MLPDIRDYEQLTRQFCWQLPENFNIGDAVSTNWAARSPDKPAIITRHANGKADILTYGALDKMANQYANALRHLNITIGDRVALVLPQMNETAAAHIALYKLGAIAVPLAMLFGIDALQFRLNMSGAKAAFISHESISKLAEIRPTLPHLNNILCIDGTGDAIEDFSKLANRASDNFTTVATTPDTPCLMIFTSGTTGPAKGALHGHRVLLGHLPGVQFAHEFFPQPGDLLWTPSDWAWAGGLLNVLLPSLYLGVAVIAARYEKFDPDAAWHLLADMQVRNIFIPPTALKLMRAQSLPFKREKLSLRTVFSGGEAVGPSLQDWAQDNLGLKINEIYGQTECNLVLESCNAIGVWRRGAIGKAVPGHKVAIVSDDGEICQPGATGNIAIARPDPVMFLEYWHDKKATAEKFIGDWLITGDQGYCDDEGYFYFVGRDDDVITSAGYRIGPGEVEDCLTSHPAVKLAAVVGKPDKIRTEIIKAFIVLNDDFSPSPSLVDEITAHVRTRLSAHEYPREIAFRDELPLTTTGKVIRRILRDQD